MEYEKVSLDCLLKKQAQLQKDLDEYEKMLTYTKSFIYMQYVKHLINKASAELHKIECELLFRNKQ